MAPVSMPTAAGGTAGQLQRRRAPATSASHHPQAHPGSRRHALAGARVRVLGRCPGGPGGAIRADAQRVARPPPRPLRPHLLAPSLHTSFLAARPPRSSSSPWPRPWQTCTRTRTHAPRGARAHTHARAHARTTRPAPPPAPRRPARLGCRRAAGPSAPGGRLCAGPARVQAHHRQQHRGQGGGLSRAQRCLGPANTVLLLCLDGDGSFWANRGLETVKTVSD
jgi:hypothetical protein